MLHSFILIITTLLAQRPSYCFRRLVTQEELQEVASSQGVCCCKNEECSKGSDIVQVPVQDSVSNYCCKRRLRGCDRRWGRLGQYNIKLTAIEKGIHARKYDNATCQPLRNGPSTLATDVTDVPNFSTVASTTLVAATLEPPEIPNIDSSTEDLVARDNSPSVCCCRRGKCPPLDGPHYPFEHNGKRYCCRPAGSFCSRYRGFKRYLSRIPGLSEKYDWETCKRLMVPEEPTMVPEEPTNEPTQLPTQSLEETSQASAETSRPQRNRLQNAFVQSPGRLKKIMKPGRRINVKRSPTPELTAATPVPTHAPLDFLKMTLDYLNYTVHHDVASMLEMLAEDGQIIWHSIARVGHLYLYRDKNGSKTDAGSIKNFYYTTPPRPQKVNEITTNSNVVRVLGEIKFMLRWHSAKFLFTWDENSAQLKELEMGLDNGRW